MSLLTALIGWISWTIVAYALRPVGAIRTGLAAITVKDLSRRVPQPHGGDEIAHLAETANHTLDRMERAIRRQRTVAEAHAGTLVTECCPTGVKFMLRLPLAADSPE